LRPGEHHLVGIDDDDVVAVIDVGREGRLVLAAQPHRDDRGEAADDEPLASISTHFFSMSAALAEYVDMGSSVKEPALEPANGGRSTRAPAASTHIGDK
jgi:hypothetical protein